MKLFKTSSPQAFIYHLGNWFVKEVDDWDALINRVGLLQYLSGNLGQWVRLDEEPTFTPSAPIGSQEVWAAGVTYLKSKIARMEEAEDAGGGDFYDKVYDAVRPEIFFKSTADRTVGPSDHINIRRDSSWDVPEPEMTLFVSSNGTIEGYTIGNDVSSRSIEGENPLYLPQAKSYDRSASLGPCIYLTANPLPPDTPIEMVIYRQHDPVYQGRITIAQMKRTFEELVEFLFRECSFPKGCFLMTGTCLVPGSEFTLQNGDVVKIKIDPIGELVNTVGMKGL